MNKNVRIGITYIVISIVFLGYAGMLTYQRHNPSRLSFSQGPQAKPAATIESVVLSRRNAPKPVRIVSSSLKIDLPIDSTRIKDAEWTVSDSGVSYLESSPRPGARGNSILYGHNWPALLGRLTRAKPGDTFTIVASDGSRTDFTIDKTAILTPKDYSVLNNTLDTRVTIYTCTGFMDSKRFVATARPTSL